MPAIIVYGIGVDVILYEVSKDDFEEIKQQVENEEVDWDELECRPEEANFMGASWPLDVLHDDSNESIYSYKELESKASKESATLTENGSFYLLKVEKYKGRWVRYELPAVPKLEDLDVAKRTYTLGSGGSALSIELGSLYFEDSDEASDRELSAYSISYYLIDDAGSVAEFT
jgi:hypothetical protein